jgi:hypothetical protein
MNGLELVLAFLAGVLINPGVLLPLLGAILALLGLEASAVWRGVR